MLLILDDKPELPPVAAHIVALKDRQEFCQGLRIGTVRIVAPHFVVAFPVKDEARVMHVRTAQPDALPMQDWPLFLRLTGTRIFLDLPHPKPLFSSTLLPPS